MKNIFLRTTLLFCIVFFTTSFLQSQSLCGTTIEDLHANAASIKEMRIKYPVGTTSQPRAVSYVPVWFHLVALSDGTGRVAEWKVLDMLCDWNKAYEANGIALQFYLKGFNYINNDAAYNYPRSLTGDNAVRTNKKADGANIYITNSATAQAGQGTVLAYYTNRQYTTDPSYTNDWIVMIKSQVGGGTNAFTIAHEMGHLFSLLHTFSGWESQQFVPTAQKLCAPIYASDNVTLTEKHSRGTDGNCADAGDLMCDTPEDYDFGYGYNGCTYAGIAQDPTCTPVTPSEKNIMGYFVGCLNNFSGQQKEAITNNYLYDRGRQYLRNLNITPSLTEIGTTNIVAPTYKGTVNGFDNITVSWSPTDGATGYYLEVSSSASYTTNESHFLLTGTGTSFNINSANMPAGFLKPDTYYYWRVRGMSSYKNCANFASGIFLTTSGTSAVNNIPDVSDFNVYPNPITNSKSVEITLSLEKPLDAVIKIVGLNGQIISQEKKHFDSGFTTDHVDLSNLQNGMFILRIESDRGVLNRKITMAN